MTKEEFFFHLQGASFQALKFAENYVKTELKTNFTYNVIFTESQVHKDVPGVEFLKRHDKKMVLEIKDSEVVDLLYVKGKIPIWIDINVLKSSRKATTFNLLCSGEYSSEKKYFYYNVNGSGPFGVKSPNLPPGYKEGQKFKLK